MVVQQVELSYCEKIIINTVYKYQEINELSPKASDIQHASLSMYGRDWQMQTILTFLRRLIDKGYLITERKGSSRYFIPAYDREEFLHMELYDMAALYCNGDVEVMKQELVGL